MRMKNENVELFAGFHWDVRYSLYALILLAVLFAPARSFAQKRVAAVPATTSLAITSEPNAIIEIYEIGRGKPYAPGNPQLLKVSAGRHPLRVRAIGLKEETLPLIPARHSV